MSAHTETSSNIVEIPTKYYLMFCIIVSLIIGGISSVTTLSSNVLGTEVFITVVSLFIFGSIKYRIDKNAITYGATIIIITTFWPMWWPTSDLKKEMATRGGSALWEAIHHNFLSLSGLEHIIHADTMLFILGLTFFVSVISQTRLLETVSMSILKALKGNILSTVLLIGGIVSFASGILDGVSMIGLTIRVFVILLAMANFKNETIKFVVMVSVILTTVCGMWLAYGEPPNLIMKSNLKLEDSFFITYAMPMAIATFFIVVAFLYSILKGAKVVIEDLDILELNIADIKFMQSYHTGESPDMYDILKSHKEQLGSKADEIYKLCEAEHHPLSAMLEVKTDEKTVNSYIKEYLGEKFIEPVYSYYAIRAEHKGGHATDEEHKRAEEIKTLLADTGKHKNKAQLIGKLAFIPFIALLITHAKNHDVPLFVSSFVGFTCAYIGIKAYPKMKKLAIAEGKHEYSEYLFLFPLFLSITMLTNVGFFDQLKSAIEHGTKTLGATNVAIIQFYGSGLLSAILDNNVVADFASRAIVGMHDIFTYASAQIAGYAVGGSLTHIGSAQSVVAYAFILRYVDPDFTPMDWIKYMWKLVVSIAIVLTIIIYIRS